MKSFLFLILRTFSGFNLIISLVLFQYLMEIILDYTIKCIFVYLVYHLLCNSDYASCFNLSNYIFLLSWPHHTHLHHNAFKLTINLSV